MMFNWSIRRDPFPSFSKTVRERLDGELTRPLIDESHHRIAEAQRSLYVKSPMIDE